MRMHMALPVQVRASLLQRKNEPTPPDFGELSRAASNAEEFRAQAVKCAAFPVAQSGVSPGGFFMRGWYYKEMGGKVGLRAFGLFSASWLLLVISAIFLLQTRTGHLWGLVLLGAALVHFVSMFVWLVRSSKKSI
jgi:hypothetical protein